jgi:hypothetical protein
MIDAFCSRGVACHKGRCTGVVIKAARYWPENMPWLDVRGAGGCDLGGQHQQQRRKYNFSWFQWFAPKDRKVSTYGRAHGESRFWRAIMRRDAAE